MKPTVLIPSGLDLLLLFSLQNKSHDKKKQIM